MIFGDTTHFAAEAEFTGQSGHFIYGRFRVWVGGSPIGTFSEEVLTLLSTIGVLRRPVPRASPVAAGLPAKQFLEKVWLVAYGAGPYDADEYHEWSPYVWFESCEGFENVRSVIANVGANHRIVWQIKGQEVAMVQFVPETVYESVASDFIAWLDSGIQERLERSKR